jgi:hypothetical protein
MTLWQSACCKDFTNRMKRTWEFQKGDRKGAESAGSKRTTFIGASHRAKRQNPVWYPSFLNATCELSRTRPAGDRLSRNGHGPGEAVSLEVILVHHSSSRRDRMMPDSATTGVILHLKAKRASLMLTISGDAIVIAMQWLTCADLVLSEGNPAMRQK